jgi:hypothetical protein
MLLSKNTLILLFLLPLCFACKDDDPTTEVSDAPKTTIYEANYSRFDIKENDHFENSLAEVIDYKLLEISGVVSGRKNKGLIYVHEDSGNSPVVFMFDKKGKLKGMMRLSGINNRDWEDIAIGPGPIDGETYIYVGDIGDNSAVRSSCRIYRFIEPQLTQDQLGKDFVVNISDFDIIDFQYPDGARDAETLMIDQESKDLIIVSKRDPQVRVYSLPYPQKVAQMTTATFHGFLPLKRMLAGDISADNKEILMKDDGSVYHWNVEDGNPIRTLFKQQPTRVAYIPEEQGEAVGWDENGYFTISESRSNNSPTLYYYQRK